MQQPPYESPNYGAYRAGPEPPPPPQVSVMDAFKFGLSLRHDFSSVMIAVVFMLIPVIGPIALQGWYSDILQRLARKDQGPLPRLTFDGLMPYLSRGVAGFVASLVYSLPFGLVVGVGVGVSAVGVSIATHDGGGDADMVPLAMLGVMFVTMLVSLPLMGLVNAAMTRAELTEDYSEAFKFGPIWTYFRATWTKYLGASILFGLLAMLLMFGGMLLCFVGIYPASILAQLGTVHLRAQIYEWALARGVPAVPIKPPQYAPPYAPARAY